MQDFHLMAHICHRLSLQDCSSKEKEQWSKFRSFIYFKGQTWMLGLQVGVSTLLPIVSQKKLHIGASHISSRIIMRADPCARI